MKRMFTSATLKLTGWYLLILITIALLFSFIIYELSTSEISSRLERLQIRLEGGNEGLTLPGPLTLTDIRINQTEEAKTSIFIGLVYMNIAVISIGGIGSYMLARRTLRPIEEAHDAQSRFTSYASHELRTPLAVIKSEIQVALRDPGLKKADLVALLESNLEEVDKLSNLSESLLQLSRLDYGSLDKTDRVDILLALKTAVKSLKIPNDRIEYKLSSQKAFFVDGSRSMLEDMLQILLDNAVKYSPSNTPITVTVSANGRTCLIQVTNEGEGIAKKDIDKVFERFYRTSSSQGQEGYGLGLSLAKKIIALHEGTIEAESIPGKKTSFIVTLPQVRKNR